MPITNTINHVTANQAYHLMDKAVGVENMLVNLVEEARHPDRYVNKTSIAKKNAWLSADDIFNHIRNEFGLQSYQEALNDTEHTLHTSTNFDSLYYADKDLHDLKKVEVRQAKYVVPNSKLNSIVPASASKDIIPFIRDVEKHNRVFKRFMENY